MSSRACLTDTSIKTQTKGLDCIFHIYYSKYSKYISAQYKNEVNKME